MTFDLVVIGAGPAGLSAAAEAARLGLSVLLADEQAEAGGQIYRGGFARSARLDAILGADYLRRDALIAELSESGIDYRSRRTLIAVEGDDVLLQCDDESLEQVQARHLLLATGAQERPWAFPGWTLPGVMGLGAAQVLLKSAGLVPEGPVVIAGSGPLIYLAALQLHRAGAQIAVVLDTTPRSNYGTAATLLPAALPEWQQLAKGLGMIADLRRIGIPVRAISDIAAEGDGRLVRVRAGRFTIAARHLLIHQGVIPQMQIARALGLREEFDPLQIAWRPQVDIYGRTSLETVGIAGDGSGIGGAVTAEWSGRLAALDAARRLGKLDDAAFAAQAAPLRRKLDRNRGLRRFLDTLYAPAAWTLAPHQADTVICRCEEVTVDELRQAASLGASGLNQTKSYTRCGMGPCQGRICGPVAAQVIAEQRGCTIADVAMTRPRFPLKPVSVAALAALKRD